jgi:hypothetical protein
MWYGFLADLVVAIHVGYVGYVVVGQLIIWLGLACKWSWVRNPWFRWTHLLAILLVAGEAAFNIMCPLTAWEADLRRLAGQTATEGTFVGRLLDNLLFIDLPLWVFPILHISFAVLVLGTFVLAPPRRKRRTDPSSALPVAGNFSLTGFQKFTFRTRRAMANALYSGLET